MSADGPALIGLLGPIAVGSCPVGAERPDRLVGVPGLRARRLLVALALAEGHLRSADRLIDDVWADDPPRSPHSALHTQVSRLRKLLPEGVLEGTENGYRLRNTRTDLDVVDKLLTEGDREANDRARQWWRGVPGDDLGDGSPVTAMLSTRIRRTEDALDAAQLTAALAEGDFATARFIAEQRCARDPFDEAAHSALMRALAGEGRATDALAVFDRLRRRLSAELGMDPGAEVARVHADILAATPRPASSAPRPTRAVGLRSPTTELIGRGADLDTMAGMLDTGRVVTVLGPGGVGKTRVATEMGHRLHATGVPVYFVSLASVRSDDDVIPAIAATLGVGESDLSATGRPRMTPGDLTARLEDVLREQPSVVILDNCEQIVDACARIVAELTAAVPGLRVLSTSRTPLAIAGEQVHQLPVLAAVDADSPAVQLFRARARAVRPDADLPPERVVELCRHLDGLPLAIELAAARIRTMTVEEIADRLGEKFALLRSADRTTPDRHRTLYAVIEWSWELLDDAGRAALVRLCRFPGGFDRSAARAVTGAAGAILDDTLESLTNQSLLSVVETDGSARFRMLEMVREFGETRMDADLATRVESLMRRWAIEFVSEMRDLAENGDHTAGAGGLAREADNLTWILRSACESAATSPTDDVVAVLTTLYPALAYHWTVRGLHGETRAWGARVLMALPRPPEAPDDAVRENWQVTAIVGAVHGTMTGELRVIATARFILRGLHRPGLTYDRASEFVSAVALASNAIRGYRMVCRAAETASDDEVRALALTMRSHLRENRGLLGPALRDSIASGDWLTRSRYASWFQGMWQSSTGSLYAQQGRYAAAASRYRDGIDLLGRLHAVEDVRQLQTFLALTLLSDGRVADARRELAVIVDDWDLDVEDPQGNPEVTGPALLGVAELALVDGLPEDEVAAMYARAARIMLRDHPFGVADPAVLMVVSGCVAGLVRCGDIEAARELVPQMVKGLDDMMFGPGWQDLPQAGTVAAAFTVLYGADRESEPLSRRLVELTLSLPGRQDYPSLRWARQWSERRIREHGGAARRVPRRIAVDELADVIRDQALRM
ncbi:BTAD domain-containing putative transcriptional regulator [Gordonia terrae]|uniref:AfsR family transcriptional regulator n=2 Tax=Gordonia terrae TaxID=2055 RepID=A0AAD0NXC8_9ACTN|nr:BTAD domain-containing putative transcriptional regulator [Gordonia terrae]VTR07309.1 diguanylate cyclase domain-containing protein [Clostridioides difficile]ANY22838.1 AfsR family transcriptional regulator [Gordonia terrae]AWO83573.1 AfsR family transcriptional regulator [Gordonia terrae]VTS43187.1 Regulatory protein AfsR [Gordonia terrae]GAB44084.1 putative AfsR family transcriptional regulator [Gordonia terrae NBRC 100016]